MRRQTKRPLNFDVLESPSSTGLQRYVATPAALGSPKLGLSMRVACHGHAKSARARQSPLVDGNSPAAAVTSII